jgi:hypothetical protein
MNNCRLAPKRASRALTRRTDRRPLAAGFGCHEGREHDRDDGRVGYQQRDDGQREDGQLERDPCHTWKPTLGPGAAKALQKMIAIVGAPTASRIDRAPTAAVDPQ